MHNSLFRRAIILSIFTGFGFWPIFASAEELVLQLVPEKILSRTTNDANTFGKLQDAVDKAVSEASNRYDLVRILVDTGNYTGQSVETVGRPGGRALVITSKHGGDERPTFDGSGKAGYFFKLANETGKPTNITLDGFVVKNYVTAITFNGNRMNPAQSNGGNVIKNMLFQNIGDIAKTGSGPSTAAIRFVNSDGNKIIANKFIHIRNNVRCELLHSVYIAHGSTENIISDNEFYDGCGVTIKVRDSSNNNQIMRNKFVAQETQAAFADAYCKSGPSGNCTEGPECPSWGNVFSDNTISAVGKFAKILPARVIPNAIPTACPTAPRGVKRIIENANSIVHG
jgi:hypothetical protein